MTRVTCVQPSKLQSNSMPNRSTYLRFMAVPVCLIWGVVEFFALQRARFQIRRAR